MSNWQSSFHVIDLKRGTEPSLTPQWLAAANQVVARCGTLPAARCAVEPIAWKSVVMNIYAQAGLAE